MPLGDSSHPGILLVKDEPLIRDAIGRILSRSDYLVDKASSGEDALALAQARTYDVVLTDLKMPGMDGQELAKRFRAMNPGQKVILVTGVTATTGQAESEAIVTKPFSASALLGAVSTVLAKSP